MRDELSRSGASGRPDERTNLAAPAHGRTTVATRFHEAGPDGRIGLVPLANYLQQAAGEHAETLGLGARRLRGEGLFWVLTRQYIEVDQWPDGGAQIAIETWPSDRPRQLFRRDFLARDSSDAVFARAASTWALIDGQTRRAVKAPPWIAESIAYDTRRAVQFPTRRNTAIEHPTHERQITTRWADLDQNGHVNNASLAGFVLEALPPAYLQSHRLASIDLVFRAECGPNEFIRSRAISLAQDCFGHESVLGNARQAVRATTVWRSS